ncbi:MAG: efflux RND transporter permease subunit [Polyangiales bacterium]
MSTPAHDTSEVSLRGPLAWMAQNSVAANVLMVMLLAGGLFMVQQIKQEVFPHVELDLVTVQVSYPGASPDEVEEGVVLAVEEAVRGLDGIKEVRSTVTEGNAAVSVELLLGTDRDRALSDIKSAVDRITSFPQDAERPIISLISSREQVLSLVLYGDRSEAELKAVAERVRDGLLQDARITYVEVAGVRPLEIGVEVPAAQLRQHDLTLQEIARRIRTASIDLPGGGIKTPRGEVLLRTKEKREQGLEFRHLVLQAQADGSELRLGDIAHIKDDFRDTDEATYYNGQRAVEVKVFRVGDDTPIDVAYAAKQYAQRHKHTLPKGVHIATWWDTSEMFEGRIELLLRNASIGLVLVLLVLGLFLDLRLAFWVTLGIPISFVGALVFMPSADVSINMISLFAFIVTLGMVVDDAIVVGEAIHKHRRDGQSGLKAAIAGVREVATPVTFSILTTCIAFAPMLFVPGVAGKFFRVIPIIVILVLLISLVESLLILPAHLAHSRVKERAGSWMARVHARQQRISALVDWFIDHTYAPVLRRALRHRYFTLSVALALLIAAVGTIVGGRVSFSFMPKIDGDVITCNLRMPYGTAAAHTEALAQRITAAAKRVSANVRADGVHRGILTRVGTSSSRDGGPDPGTTQAGSHVSSVLVYLVPSEARPLSARQFAERWRSAVGEIAGAESLNFRFSIGASPGAPIDFELSHPDEPSLRQAAAELAAALQKYNGVRDIDDGFDLGKEQLDLQVRPAARAHGLNEAEVARQVRSAFFGAEALRQQRGRDELRVYVRLPEADRRSLHTLEDLVLVTPAGGEIPFRDAVSVRRGHAYTQITRTDGRQTVNVTADIDEKNANANKIVAAVRKNFMPQLLGRHPGLSYRLGGEQREQAETLGSLGAGFLMAMLAMLGLLSIAFRSYVLQPLIVMSAIPFGMVGALIGHLIMGFDLSLMSMMGVVALSGVVVNDSLILVVATNTFRAAGLQAEQAVTAGGLRRFRPILLTSLTTFFGLSPMIAETSVQARFLIPMAISLGFGVLFATFIILLLVPASYLIVDDIKRQFRRIVHRIWPPEQPSTAQLSGPT